MGQSFGHPPQRHQATKEDEASVKKFLIVATAALAAFFIALPAAAQTNREMQMQNHPCEGGPFMALDSLRNYFWMTFQARSTELKDIYREVFIKHYGIEDLDITNVYLFQSYMQKKLAVVSAKRVSGILCVVKVRNQLAIEIHADDLTEILTQEQTI